MDSKKIENQIRNKQKSLGIIQKDILDKEAELTEKQTLYSKSILSHADSQKKPASLDAQRDRVSKTQIELTGLEGVQTLLESEITGLEAELKLCQLYETDGKRFNQSLATCGALTSKLAALGKSLNEDIVGFNQAVGELFGATESGISSFSTIHGGLDRGFSLATFLDGTLEESESCDHDTILKQAGGELQTLALTPQIDVDVVQGFLTKVQSLNDWQRTVAKHSPEGLIVSRYTLRPPEPKVIPLDGESARADRALAAKHEREVAEGHPLRPRQVVH